MGNRTAAISSSSPAKRDSSANSKPLFSSSDDAGERHRSWYLFFHRSSSSLIRSALEGPRGLWILIASGGFLIFLGFMFMLAAWSQLSGPYLCYKDEINLQCPRVNEARLLWENPHASTTLWKPCAEWRENGISDLLPENETSGYIFIHAEGGLNQQRIAICNAVAVAKIMNATLILPVLKQDQIWKEKTNFEDI